MNLHVPARLRNAVGDGYGDFFRKMLGIDNALFMSIDSLPYESYTLCILNAPLSRVNEKTIVTIADEGVSGRYLLPVLPVEYWIHTDNTVEEYKNLLEWYTNTFVPKIKEEDECFGKGR
jgi:hypothetical protein